MKKVKWNGNYFLTYDSIQEMPAENFFKFNLNIAIESGIGSDVDAVSKRSAELRGWIAKDKKEEALKALANYEAALTFLISNVSPGTMAFVCMVHSCNGVEVTDLSDDGLSRYILEWSRKGLTIGKIRGLVEQAKKKFDLEQETFFPKLFNSPSVIEMANQMKRRSIASLQIIQGVSIERNEKIMAAVDDILLKIASPKQYGGHDGFEVSRIHNFEDSLVLIGEKLQVDVFRMTAFQFIKNCEILKKRFAASKGK